jgi:hypothetical protein
MTMRTKLVPILVLAIAAAGLVGSGAWAVNRESTHGPGWMHSSSIGWMMGYRTGSASPVETIAQARSRAQAYADRLDLKVAEVIHFTNNFYARLDDKSGHPATEVLVDPATGSTSLEYGPAMMWNTRYGMMTGRARSGMMGGGMMGSASGMMGSASGMMGSTGGGMMGAGSGMMGASGPTWTPSAGTVSAPVSAQQALTLARRWLAQRDTTLTIRDADSFPGYFTMETLRNGKVHGMLSVNASTGAIWDHWWHGSYLAISE